MIRSTLCVTIGLALTAATNPFRDATHIRYTLGRPAAAGKLVIRLD